MVVRLWRDHRTLGHRRARPGLAAIAPALHRPVPRGALDLQSCTVPQTSNSFAVSSTETTAAACCEDRSAKSDFDHRSNFVFIHGSTTGGAKSGIAFSPVRLSAIVRDACLSLISGYMRTPEMKPVVYVTRVTLTNSIVIQRCTALQGGTRGLRPQSRLFCNGASVSVRPH